MALFQCPSCEVYHHTETELICPSCWKSIKLKRKIFKALNIHRISDNTRGCGYLIPFTKFAYFDWGGIKKVTTYKHIDIY